MLAFLSGSWTMSPFTLLCVVPAGNIEDNSRNQSPVSEKSANTWQQVGMVPHGLSPVSTLA